MAAAVRFIRHPLSPAARGRTHLGHGDLVLLGNLGNLLIVHLLAVAKRAVSLNLDALLLEKVNRLLAVEEGVHLNLVHDGLEREGPRGIGDGEGG